LQFAVRTVNESGAKMHPDVRRNAEARITPWIRGKYENLKRHEARQVRLGKVAKLEADAAADAVREANDVAMLAMSTDEAFGEEAAEIRLEHEENLRTGGMTDPATAKRQLDERMEYVARKREAETARLVAQVASTSQSGEDRFRNAVETGLISETEGAMRRNRYRRAVFTSVIGALLERGKADQAEAFLDVLERGGAGAADGRGEIRRKDGLVKDVASGELRVAGDGGGAGAADGSVGRDGARHSQAAGGTVAKECGFMPDELAKFRRGIDAARKRAEAAAKSAEAERLRAEANAKAERERAAMDEIAKEDIAAARTPFPETAEARGVQSEAEAARFDRYAEDERLPAATRAKYAQAARSVRAAERRMKAEEKAAAEKAREKAAADAQKAATDAEKRRVEGIKDAMLTTEARAVALRATGGAEDARKANELESDLYVAVQRGFADGRIPAETYTAYMKRRGQQLTADECRAMARFDAAMGLADDFETDDSGEVKNAASLKRGSFEAANGKRFRADVVLAFRKRFLGELRKLGKDVNREDVVAKTIDRVSAKAFAAKFGEEADAAVIAALEEAQVGMRAAAVARGAKGNGKRGTGNREREEKTEKKEDR